MFGRASDAVPADSAIQVSFLQERWPLAESPRVRIARHTGEGDLRPADHHAPALTHRYRLSALAHGAQIVIHALTASLERKSTPAQI